MSESQAFRLLIDFACGSASGVANCMSGYVLDTLKVRMQTNPNVTFMGSFKEVVATEGILNLFNGMYYPLMTVPLVNAVIFGSYEFYKRIRGKDKPTFWDGIESGAFSGLVNTIVVNPVELVKILMQADQEGKFQNSRQCLQSIVEKQGLRGIFKGSISTGLREIPAYAGQFAAYQAIKSNLVSERHPNLNVMQAIFVGAIAGVSCWLCSYPQDVVKTRIQISPEGTYPRNKFLPDGGFISCSRSIYQQAGWKGFWRGVQPCLMRGFLANAIAIAVYEKAQQFATHSSSF